MTLHVLWLDWWTGHDPGDMWDQHQLRQLLAEHHPTDHRVGLYLPPAGVTSAVVVVPGRFAHDHLTEVQALLDRLHRVLVVVTSDEEALFEYEKLTHPDMRLWVQTPRPERSTADLHLGCGPPPDTRRILADLDRVYENVSDEPACQDRPYAWVFDGQINHAGRSAMKAATAALTPPLDRASNLWTVTPGFTQGHPREAYLGRMAMARVALCPSGPHTPDSFRVWEALSAHTLPLAAAAAPHGPTDGYWQLLAGSDPPWPLVHDWTHLAGHLAAAVQGWPGNLNRAVAWWLRYQQHLRHVTADTVSWLTDTLPPLDGPPVTVLLATSPILSNPDTSIVEATMASVRERLPNADVVLMIDGPRFDLPDDRRAAYAEYTRRLLWLADHRWGRCTPLVFDDWCHQVAMTAVALDHVHTPTVLFVEHDTPLEQDVPFDTLVRPILSGAADVIRLHHESEILPVHRYLMLDGEPQTVDGVPMMRTRQWSQRPHLASTAYYRERIAQVNGTLARCFIEDVMIGIVDRAFLSDGETGWFRNRLWVYTPPGNIRRSHHLDGRGPEPKGPQRFDYPTEVPPEGAPQPRWISG